MGKTPAGHDVCVIAHRFGWGLRHGLDALLEVPVISVSVLTGTLGGVMAGGVKAGEVEVDRHR